MSFINPARGQWTPHSKSSADRARLDAARHVLVGQRTERRNSLLAGIAISILVPLTVSALVFGAWIEWTPDGFLYLALAREFLESGRFPAERMTTPPGFPLLLSPLMSAGDLPLAGIRVLLAGGFISTCVLTFLLFRQLIGDGWAIFAAALTGLSAALLVQSTSLLSESIYLPMSMLALLILTRWSHSGPDGLGDLMSGGLAVAGAWAVRSTGILLVPIAAWTAFRGGSGTFATRLGRAVLVTLIALAPVVAWELRQSQFPARHGYLDSLLKPREALDETATGWALQQARLARFGPERMADLAAAVIPPHVGWRLLSGPWSFPTACVLSTGVLVAAAHGLIRHRRPADAYLILFVALLVVWPWKEGARLMAPLAPICIGYVACTGRRLWESRGRISPWARAASVGMAACALALVSWESCLNVGSLRDRASVSQRRQADMQTLGDWMSANVAQDGCVHAIVPAGSQAKLALLGGRFLARRDVQIDHGLPGEAVLTRCENAAWWLVHRSIKLPQSAAVVGGSHAKMGEFVAIKTGQ